MAQSAIPFSFNNHSVRIIMRDGEPWFICSDVANALGYRDAANAARNLNPHQKGTHNMSTLGGSQDVTIINESGLYKLVLRSRKPEAELFADWVTDTVLPSIRKTGSYSTAPATIEEKPNPSIDVKTLLLEGHCDPFLPLPASVQKAIDKKAWAMAHEAYELCREHLNRRVAYYASVGYPRRLDRQRALSVIKRGNLNYALAHSYWHELSYIAHEIHMVSRQSVKFKDKMEKMMTRFEEGKF